jgi:hypothetical protein
MTDALAISALALALAAAGWRLGFARFGLVLASMLAGGAAAVAAGPLAQAAIARGLGWNTWLGVAFAWMGVYAAVSTAVAILLCRRVRRPVERRGRAAGSGLGLMLGALGVWACLAPPPRALEFEPVGWVQVPFATLRALRILRSLSPAEAQWVAGQPEVKAVIESESLQRLMRDPAIVRKVQRAADGDRLALLALAADPEVKAAMDEPAFLDRVLQVDLPGIAEAIVRRRAEGRRESGIVAAAAPTAGAWQIGFSLGTGLVRGILRLQSDPSDASDLSDGPP